MAEAMVLTNAYLKGVMTDAMVLREACVDLDLCKRNGIYTITAATINSPFPDLGVVEVMTRGSASSNLGYIQSRIQAIVKSETVSKCRAVISGNRIYIDLLFAKGGGLPTIGLIGAIGVNLLTPSIAPEAPDPAKVYSYEL